MSRRKLPTNDEVTEYVGVEPRDHTVTQPTKEGIKHKPDTPEDLYRRRIRRSKQHL